MRLPYSWRLTAGRTPFIHTHHRPHIGWSYGLQFVRYEPEGIDWRYWRLHLGPWHVLLERPTSDLDGERLRVWLDSH